MASALETNSTWPFINMNNFQERSESTRSLSGVMTLNLLPIVTNETRADWEKFSNENSQWLMEAVEYQTKNGIGQIEGETTPPMTIVLPTITTIDESNGTVMVDPGVRARIDVEEILTSPGHSSHSIICLPSAAGTILSSMAILSYISSTDKRLQYQLWNFAFICQTCESSRLNRPDHFGWP